MRNSWKVFTRDVGRIARQRKVWIIVIGVLITPALYAWFNINAFWDPYSNTGNIRVAVVNLDEGATSEVTGDLDVGKQVTDQLEDDTQLGWQFMSEAEAQEAVKSGDVYAAIVIPADFSKDLASITSGTFTQPALTYYVNEKASAISPKITDVGASGIDTKITEAFVEQVALAATDALKDAGVDLEDRLDGARSDTLEAFDQASETVSSAREDIADIQDGLSGSRTSLASAASTLDDVDATLADVQTSIAQAQKTVAEAQKQVVAFADAAASAYVDGATLLADASAQANVSVTELTQAFDQVDARIAAALRDVTAVTEANAAALENLQALLDDPTLDPAVADQLSAVVTALQERNAADQDLLGQLTDLNDDAGTASSNLRAAGDALAKATAQAQDSASGIQSALTATVPELTRSLAALSSSASALSSAIDAQRTQLAQAGTLLTALDRQLVSTSVAVGSIDDNLGGILDGLDTARTDLLALGTASSWGDLSTVTGLDPSAIASFIATPVDVVEHAVFPVATYGSAMAALFTNLSLWIGAFVLMVIFKVEVDTEGIDDLTVGQAYVGRFLLLGSLVVGQALTVSIGNLVIGIQTVSAVAFVGTSVLIGLAYLSIIYALSVAFGHVGRGLCVVLVIMQIPGASGLYPIEMMPDFFRQIYPFLPFTYGIDALRETIGGFYDGHYWGFLGALALFTVLAWLLGIVLRSRLAGLNLVFNREIDATGIMISEKVQVRGPGYRLSDVIHALGDRSEYRDDLARRAAPFTRRYPALLRATFIVGAVGLVALGIIAWVLPGGKASLLGIWVLWCLLIIAFLITVEYISQSFALASEVGRLNDDALRAALLQGGPRRRGAHPETAPTRVLTAVDDAPTDGEGSR